MDRGAHFHRCDFQVHSPRDLRWKGKEYLTAEARQAYATALIGVCRQKGLDAIAITDHHDLCFCPYVRQAASVERDADGEILLKEHQIVVFPGIELTIGIPCQAIMILDSDFEEIRLSSVLTALKIDPNPDTESRTAQTARLEHIQSFKQLKEELDGHSWLKDRYIIFPNVSGEGKFSILRAGMTGKYKEMPCVGGYLDGSEDRLNHGSRNILDGRAKEWGFKKVAFIQTSDNRTEEHSDLGRHTTWIKWAVPTAEALRQACLAQESRIVRQRPRLPVVHIESLAVSNSKFMGRIFLPLNRQYNALIGGRGTGKSTILEYLRWALCDQPPTLGDEDVPDYEKRRQRLIDNTLKPFHGTVDVNFRLNDVIHIVRRDGNTGGLRIRVGGDEFRECSEEEVRRLLPIQAYSQKQLSGVSIRVDELERFVMSPIRGALDDLGRRIDERAVRLQETYAKVRRRESLAKQLERRHLEERSLAEQVEQMRESLTGISDEDRELLALGKHFALADRLVEHWRNEIRALAERAQVLLVDAQANAIEPIQMPELPDVEMAVVLASRHYYHKFMGEAAKDLERVVIAAGAALADRDGGEMQPWAAWLTRSELFRESYKKAVGRSTAEREQMERLESLDARLSQHQSETARIGEELKDLDAARGIYDGDREAWMALREQYDSLLQAQCERLTETSGGSIRARLNRLADAKSFTSRLAEALAGSGTRANKLDEIASAIVNAPDPQAMHQAVLADLESLATYSPEEDGEGHRPITPTLTTIGLRDSDLNRLANRLSAQDWLAISNTPIRSEPVFEYRSREGDYIPFQDASSGQQATALLKVLLNQTGSPLIIDQPEEDLDNPVIQEIVSQVWVAKTQRQLIFASHNANLVVNGDAELVAWCDYTRGGDQTSGEIAGEGAIDVPEAREAIKRIMEGGEAAFRLRREKYGF